MDQDLQKRIEDLESSFASHQHQTIDGTLPLYKTAFINISLPDTQSQTSTNYGICFVATRPCAVKAVSEVHTVAGSSGSAVTLQIEKLIGTTTPGSGIGILSAEFNLKGTANTVQRGVLISSKQTVSGLLLGDRLAIKPTGTLTALKGVTVTIELQFI